jgi:plastocyanin
MRSFIVVAVVALAVSVPSSGHAVKGQILDPAAHGLVRLTPLELGSETDISHMEPREYRLQVGQGYRWKIKASDLQEFAFTAPAFFRNIWIRKIEVAGVEIKSPTLDEIEFEKGGEAELFFVAVRPGTYDYGSRGLMERGMVGKIIVESGSDDDDAAN